MTIDHTTTQNHRRDSLTEALRRLPATRSSIEQEIKRLSRFTSAEQTHLELANTLLPLMAEQLEAVAAIAVALEEHRRWAGEENKDMSDHLAELDDRIATVEGDDSQLTSEDAEKFARLAVWTELTAKQALETTTDPDGRKKVEEMIELATWAQARIHDIEMVPIADEDGDDDEDDEADGADVEHGGLSS